MWITPFYAIYPRKVGAFGEKFVKTSRLPPAKTGPGLAVARATVLHDGCAVPCLPGSTLLSWLWVVCHGMRGQHLKGHLDMLLLAAIAGGAEHGYAIAETLRRESAGAVDLKDGTIYPALHRLRRAGFVGSRWSPGDGRKRRVYKLTRAGREALEAQHDDWLRFEHTVRRVFALIAS